MEFLPVVFHLSQVRTGRRHIRNIAYTLSIISIQLRLIPIHFLHLLMIPSILFFLLVRIPINIEIRIGGPRDISGLGLKIV